LLLGKGQPLEGGNSYTVVSLSYTVCALDEYMSGEHERFLFELTLGICSHSTC
jgi:hypothetical protein